MVTTSHWLHRTNRRRDTKSTRRDPVTSYSQFNRTCNPEKATENHTAACRRRVCGSSASSGTVVLERGPKGVDNAPANVWSSRSLSTQDKLISPRPLGPTHILVVSQTEGGRDPASRSSGEDVLELPVNDLLLILNVPNLRTIRKNGHFVSVLPRRLHKEMPRVALHVPSLETFAEVVVYLHTKDRSALFGTLVPEWIRSIVYPAKSLASSANTSGAPILNPLSYASSRGPNEDIKLSGLQCPSFFGYRLAIKASLKCLLKPISPILLPALTTSPQPHSSATVVEAIIAEKPSRAQNDHHRKSIRIAAKEIADVFSSLELDAEKNDIESLDSCDHGLHSSLTAYPGDHAFESNVLKVTADKLNTLAANFSYLGYFEKALWLELDTYRKVIAEVLKLTQTLLADKGHTD